MAGEFVERFKQLALKCDRQTEVRPHYEEMCKNGQKKFLLQERFHLKIAKMTLKTQIRKKPRSPFEP